MRFPPVSRDVVTSIVSCAGVSFKCKVQKTKRPPQRHPDAAAAKKGFDQNISMVVVSMDSTSLTIV